MRIGEESAGSSEPAAELREAQRQLRSERGRYFELFQLAPVGLLVTDLRGQITEINQAACDLLGMAPRSLLGKPLATFVESQERHDFRNRLEQRVEERTRDLQEEQALLEAVVYNAPPGLVMRSREGAPMLANAEALLSVV